MITNRADQAQVTCSFDHEDLVGYDPGLWNIRQGGRMQSNSTKGQLPAGGGSISFGGKRTPANITLRKYYDPVADGAYVVRLHNACGEAVVTVREVPVDKKFRAIGNGRVKWSGTLIEAALPDRDSDSNERAYLEIVIETEGDLAAG